jgi:mRNA interferase RelE/StbE
LHRICITPQVKRQLKVLDSRTRAQIAAKIDLLRDEPEKRGKALQGSLAGFRSMRAAGQRYRIIYLVENREVVVLVIGIGIRKEGDRKDIYSLMKKLVNSGLLEGDHN